MRPPERHRKSDVPRRDGRVQSLDRALRLLNLLGQADGGATLTELATRTGLAPSTAHRLLTSLEAERYVRFDAETKLWAVGVQAFIAGSGFLKTRNVVQLARPHMRRLMEESGETVNLAVEDQGAAVYLAQVECREMMRSFARLGARVPLHCSGVGKALLAAMAARERARIVGRSGLPAMTVRTITSAADLTAEMERVRARGYAVDDEEHAVGLRCVASVVHDEHGEAACAVSVSGPMARITDARLAELGEKVKATADRIAAEIGGRLPVVDDQPSRAIV